MTIPVLLAISILALAIGLLLFRVAPMLRAYFTYRGKRLVTCPETHRTAAVDVDAGKVALSALLRDPVLYLSQCSRWPEHENCGRDCLQQVEYDPDNCRVWSIVASWYEGKSCVLCGKPFRRLRHLDHPPALMSPDRKTSEWKQFPPEQLPEIFSSYSPVCWNCHNAETSRGTGPSRR